MLYFLLHINTPILKRSCIESSKLKSQANDCEILKYLMLVMCLLTFPHQRLDIIGKMPKVGTGKKMLESILDVIAKNFHIKTFQLL